MLNVNFVLSAPIVIVTEQSNLFIAKLEEFVNILDNIELLDTAQLVFIVRIQQ